MEEWIDFVTDKCYNYGRQGKCRAHHPADRKSRILNGFCEMGRAGSGIHLQGKNSPLFRKIPINRVYAQLYKIECVLCKENRRKFPKSRATCNCRPLQQIEGN